VPTNISQFKLQLRAEASLPLETFVRGRNGLALELLGRIVRRTPVDTGNARGNWQLSLTSIPGNVIPNTTSVSRSPVAEAAPVLQRGGRFADLFSQIFIVNNAEYISFLEDGSSQQAPQGMVALSISELENVNIEVFAGGG